MEEITSASPPVDAMQLEDMENHWLGKASANPIVEKSVDKHDNAIEGENNIQENLTKAPQRPVLRLLVRHNGSNFNNNNNSRNNNKIFDIDSNNGTQEFEDASDSSGEVGDTSTTESSDNSEKSEESKENDQLKVNFEDDEEKTRTEIGNFIDNMKSNPNYKLLEYRSWRFYEPIQRDVKLFDRMNLYDFAVNQEAIVLLSLGQIVQIKRRKKGVNWVILSIGHLEISRRGRFASILRREDTTDMIVVPIYDLIPDSRKIEISDQLEKLLAKYHSTLKQPNAKINPRGRKRTQPNYFTPSPPTKRLTPPTSTPKSTSNSTPNISTPKSRPTATQKSTPNLPTVLDAPHSNSPVSYVSFKGLGVNALDLDSNSNSVSSSKKMEESVPVSNGSVRHVSEGNSHDSSRNLPDFLSSQRGISNPPLRGQQYFNSNAPSCPLQLCEMYLLNQQQQIQQFQIDQNFQQQQHQRQQEYSRQQQLRHLQLQQQLETQFDLQRQVHDQFESQQHFQFQLFQQQQRIMNQMIMKR